MEGLVGRITRSAIRAASAAACSIRAGVSTMTSLNPACSAFASACCSRAGWASIMAGVSAVRRSPHLQADAWGSRSTIRVETPVSSRLPRRAKAPVWSCRSRPFGQRALLSACQEVDKWESRRADMSDHRKSEGSIGRHPDASVYLHAGISTSRYLDLSTCRMFEVSIGRPVAILTPLHVEFVTCRVSDTPASCVNHLKRPYPQNLIQNMRVGRAHGSHELSTRDGEGRGSWRQTATSCLARQSGSGRQNFGDVRYINTANDRLCAVVANPNPRLPEAPRDCNLNG